MNLKENRDHAINGVLRVTITGWLKWVKRVLREVGVGIWMPLGI